MIYTRRARIYIGSDIIMLNATDFSLRNQVIEYLRNNTNKEFTAREIAQHFADSFPDAVKEKITSSKNPNMKATDDCIQQWVAEISALKNYWIDHKVYLSTDRPRKYSILSEKIEFENQTNNNQLEKELYPKLALFCGKELNIRTLRINEKTSKNDKGSNYNMWLHADVVGFQDLTDGIMPETKDCLIEYSDERSYLYSFEVKKGVIRTSNLRQYFFQTVSNSSWANYSYLVAEGCDEAAWEELQLLCTSFKIGFIQLNKEQPLESKIEIKAPKSELDWRMINRIDKENKDFRTFLQNVTLSYKGHSDKYAATPKWDPESLPEKKRLEIEQ